MPVQSSQSTRAYISILLKLKKSVPFSKKNCHDKPFGLIANRVNRYSTNPLPIKQFFSNKHIVAGAIVGSHRATRLNAEIEVEVIDGAPVAFFTKRVEARNWIQVTVTAEISTMNRVPVQPYRNTRSWITPQQDQ